MTAGGSSVFAFIAVFLPLNRHPTPNVVKNVSYISAPAKGLGFEVGSIWVQISGLQFTSSAA